LPVNVTFEEAGSVFVGGVCALLPKRTATRRSDHKVGNVAVMEKLQWHMAMPFAACWTAAAADH
jgi:hypothetical protein